MVKIDTPVTASAETLERVLNSGLPVLLFLYKDNIPSLLESAVRRIAKNESGRIIISKIDVAENPGVALKNDLSGGIPVLIAYKDGAEIARKYQPTPGTLENYAAFLAGHVTRLETDIPANSKNGSHAAAKPIHVTDDSFVNDVLHSESPVLVDFWAEWCGPCRMIAPALEKLAGEFAGKMTIAKLNVDDNPQTAMQYHVLGIPMLLIFKNGQPVDKLVGAAPEPMLRQLIQKHAS